MTRYRCKDEKPFQVGQLVQQCVDVSEGSLWLVLDIEWCSLLGDWRVIVLPQHIGERGSYWWANFRTIEKTDG